MSRVNEVGKRSSPVVFGFPLYTLSPSSPEFRFPCESGRESWPMVEFRISREKTSEKLRVTGLEGTRLRIYIQHVEPSAFQNILCYKSTLGCESDPLSPFSSFPSSSARLPFYSSLQLQWPPPPRRPPSATLTTSVTSTTTAVTETPQVHSLPAPMFTTPPLN